DRIWVTSDMQGSIPLPNAHSNTRAVLNVAITLRVMSPGSSRGARWLHTQSSWRLLPRPRFLVNRALLPSQLPDVALSFLVRKDRVTACQGSGAAVERQRCAGSFLAGNRSPRGGAVPARAAVHLHQFD